MAITVAMVMMMVMAVAMVVVMVMVVVASLGIVRHPYSLRRSDSPPIGGRGQSATERHVRVAQEP
jgi:hypothetical protein